MKEVVKKVLHLAKLQLPEEEEKALVEHFKKVLDMVEKLKEVDTEGVEPLYYPHEGFTLRMREDAPESSLLKIEVLQNAPEAFTDYIKAPSPLRGITKKSRQ
jgi:aspartyl-tRNA(Asn)/glutamyl-tRNA(Gln) amidotransferase subunit C